MWETYRLSRRRSGNIHIYIRLVFLPLEDAAKIQSADDYRHYYHQGECPHHITTSTVAAIICHDFSPLVV